MGPKILRGAPISGASGIFPVGVVCVIGLLSTTWLHFQSLTLLYAGRECYPEASITSNSNESNVKLLTTAVMVDNLAKKVGKCPLNCDRYVLFAYNWDRESCSLYGVARCPLFRGCLSIGVNGRTVRTFGIVHYIVGARF